MVLQQAPAQASVWGFGTPGQSVSVQSTIMSSPVQAVVQPDSIWQVFLPPVTASFNAVNITAVSGGETLTLTDVLYGDVYVCSGQSNMQFTVIQAFNATEELAAANEFPYIRLFTVAEVQSATPLTDLATVDEPWSVASNTSIGGAEWNYFSAVCWFYGRDIFEDRNYPIGLIASDWGGTPVEAWSSPDALAKCNLTFEEKALELNSSVTTLTQYGGPANYSVLWNAMIYPLLRVTIFGVVWYQGENDAAGFPATMYHCTFPAMIDDWRGKWFNATAGQTSSLFPFGFVQLSTWGDTTENATCGDACSVALVRWGQTANYGFVPNERLQNVFMAVAMDLGDALSPYGDIHPRYKQQVGQRLALAGRAIAYGEVGVYFTGPIAVQAFISSPTTVSVTFADVGAQGIALRNTDYLAFEVLVGASWTAAPIVSSDYSNVVLLAPSSTTQVRYNWYQAPCAPATGIMNCAVYALEEQLPAPPFLLEISSPSY